jgi:DNA ligase (NAD+)
MTQERIVELEGLIQQARHEYYNLTPNVSDELYDAWVDELAELQANNPAVTAIGAPPDSAWLKVSHGIPMGSLDKVQSLEAIGDWIGTRARKNLPTPEQLLVTEKLDGISIHMRYDKGKFVQALTRGDGVTGEDITRNVARMKGCVATVKGKFTGSIRGEIVLHKEDLAKHFPDNSSTRNTAAGTAKRYDGAGCQHLSIYCYRIADGYDVKTEAEQFEKLAEWGFLIPNWYVTAMAPGIKTPHDLWMDYQQHKRETLAYDIDGLVVSINDMAHQISLGEHDGRPHGSVAFKFAPMARETTIKEIVWQVGGLGRITPVAVFDPVHLVGAVVTQASLYNQTYIHTLGIGLGAKVLVARANDVIPRVVSVTVPGITVAAAPEYCPSCGSLTLRDGEYVICPNKLECKAQIIGRLKLWVGEQGILEWGETLLEKVVQEAEVRDVADLYSLSQETLAKLDRMGDRSAKVAWEALHAKEDLALENIIGGLAIPNVGTTTVRMVMDAGWETWDKMQMATQHDFERVPGIGPAKAEALSRWIIREGIPTTMPRLVTSGVRIKERVKGNLTGKSFCFTGSMKHKRGELEAVVANNGGTVKSSVSKGLTFLVIADPNSGSSKAKAARKNGTTCISEEDFLGMVP